MKADDLWCNRVRDEFPFLGVVSDCAGGFVVECPDLVYARDIITDYLTNQRVVFNCTFNDDTATLWFGDIVNE